MRVAVLVSGTGSNLQSLINHSFLDNCPYTIDIVIADSYDKASKGLSRAISAKIPVYVAEYVAYKDYSAKENAELQISEILKSRGIDLIVLAGYMRILSPEFVKQWEGKIINLHPSLLPAFPGLHAIEQAYNYGVKVVGVTVHYVDEGMDTGKIIAQQSCLLKESWSLDDLETAIHSIEHRLLPEVVRKLAVASKNI